MSKSPLKALTLATCLLVSANASSVPISVDLSSWGAETLLGSGVSGAGGNWVVQPGNDSVLQTINGNASIFFEAGANAQSTALAGKITVTTTGDDDFIGFVLGYDVGEINSANSDFILVDWKQGNQGLCGGLGEAGLAISHVSGANLPGVGNNTACKFWQHNIGGINPGIQEIAEANTLGNTGWVDNQEYDFDIEFNSSLIQVSVDGMLELSITPLDVPGIASFDDGAFGFYNFSQSTVLYSAITEEDIPDPCDIDPTRPGCQPNGAPVPGTLALLVIGLAGAGCARHSGRRRRD